MLCPMIVEASSSRGSHSDGSLYRDVVVPSLIAQQWILVTSLIFRPFVSISKISIDVDLELVGIAMVDDFSELIFIEGVHVVIGFKKV